MHRNRRGFTLIEAVIAMAIAGILLGVAVPAWQDAMARSRASATRGELLATWTVAVGHAARTGTEVVLCPSAGVECRNSFDWSEGWIAFADLDGNRRRAPVLPRRQRGYAPRAWPWSWRSGGFSSLWPSGAGQTVRLYRQTHERRWHTCQPQRYEAEQLVMVI